MQTLTKSVSKQYCFADRDGKFFCTGVQNNGNNKGITVQTNDWARLNTGHSLASGNAYVMSIDFAAETKAMLEKAAPIDVRLVLNNTEELDDAKKADFFSRIEVVEITHTNTKVAKPLTAKDINTIKETIRLHNIIQNQLNLLTNSLQDLSLTECKKLQANLGVSTV